MATFLSKFIGIPPFAQESLRNFLHESFPALLFSLLNSVAFPLNFFLLSLFDSDFQSNLFFLRSFCHVTDRTLRHDLHLKIVAPTPDPKVIGKVQDQASSSAA